MPDQVFSRDVRTDITGLRAHVAMGQLEPGAGEGIREIGRVIVETFGNLPVLGIHLQRHVGVGHHRVASDGRVFDIHRLVFFADVDRLPLRGAGRALPQFPVVVEQQVEIAVIPLRRVRGPRPFDTAGHRIAANATTGLVVPAHALRFKVGGFGRRAELLGVTVAMALPDSVATGRQGDGFFVVHRHPGKGDPHVVRRLERIGLAVHTLGIDIDQAHHHGRQRVFQIALAGIAAVGAATRCQPFLFRTPVNILFRMPDIFAAKGEAEGFQAHRFVGHVAGENHQVGPADLVAVFFLDRPQQTPRLVQIDVVRPGVERREALVALAATTSPIGDPVGAGRVPGHADHQPAIVAPVGRPPGLAVGHQGLEIVFQGVDVELLELLAVIEAGTHRVGLVILLMQDVQAQRLRPPVHVRHAGRGGAAMHDRTLTAGFRHFFIRRHFLSPE